MLLEQLCSCRSSDSHLATNFLHNSALVRGCTVHKALRGDSVVPALSYMQSLCQTMKSIKELLTDALVKLEKGTACAQTIHNSRSSFHIHCTAPFPSCYRSFRVYTQHPYGLWVHEEYCACSCKLQSLMPFICPEKW